MPRHGAWTPTRLRTLQFAVALVAERLGIGLRTLCDKLKRYGIE